MGQLKHRNLFPTVLDARRTRCWQVFPETSLLVLQDFLVAAFLLCPHMAFSLGALIPGVSSSSYKDTLPQSCRIRAPPLCLI